MKHFSYSLGCLLSIVLIGIAKDISAQQPYFQQEVDYKINVSLDDHNHFLYARETIRYTNHSPDTLQFLYFHLWPNAYKNNKTAFAKQLVENGNLDFYFSSPEEKGYIDSLNFKVDGQAVKWEYDKKNIDICKLILPKSLIPGETISISTPFRVKIPGSFSRLGHEGQSYQITQWYPKPAVYDKNGWHQIPYLDQGEFYSEYGSYNVQISLPENYVVGATGNLQTDKEVKWLNDKAKDINKWLVDSNTYKTLRYTENNIHDFAWFADKRYLVSKDSVQLSNSGRWVTTWAMYPPGDKDKWKRATEYVKDAVYYYSKWYGDYPYKNCSAVKGSTYVGGAMEYPEITVVGNASTDLVLENMIAHEVGHNWFYGVLGFNERTYPYLDEGFNTFSEYRYFNQKYHNRKKLYEFKVSQKIARFFDVEDYPVSSLYEISSLLPQRINVDQPIKLKSTRFTELNYASIVYHKSALSYYYLLNCLDEHRFDSIMQGFYKHWEFKHPQPDDFRAAFESGSNQDLSWFFNDLLTTTKKLDYKVARIKGNKLLVRNDGRVISPVIITGFNNNDTAYKFQVQGFKRSKWIDLPDKKINKIIIDDIQLPEYNRKNNTIKTSGVFKKLEPLEIRKFQIFEKPDKTQLGILPAAGWNNYNKFMLGAIFYNPVLPVQKVEYRLVPMYAFGNKDFAGRGKITLHVLPISSFTNRIDFSLSGEQFAGSFNGVNNFLKLRGAVEIYLNKKIKRSPNLETLSLYATHIENGQQNEHDYLNFLFTWKNTFALHPYLIKVNSQFAQNDSRISSDFKLSFPTKYAKYAFSLRMFGGIMLSENPENPFYLSGTAMSDVQYDDIYLGRFEPYENHTLLGQQFYDREGGFAAYAPFTADKWMVTTRVKVRIPKIPVKVYGTIGTFSSSGDRLYIDSATSFATDRLSWETGFNFSIRDFLNIYFPVFVSPGIDNYLKAVTSNYGQKIRFSLNIPLLNLFNWRDLLLK